MNNILRPLLCYLFLAVVFTTVTKAQRPIAHEQLTSEVSDIIELGPVSSSVSQQVDELLLSTFSDFDQWTLSALAVPTDTILWEFTTDPQLTGTFTGQVVTSETVADGFALLNFDRYTGGDTSTPPIKNELTSPSYDLTSLDPGLFYELSFFNLIRECCTGGFDHTVEFSLDGGATFSAPQQVTPAGNNVLVSGFLNFRLPPGVENTSEFQVRFTYDEGFFFWAIDDISIIPLAAIEPEVTNFFSIAPNFETPVDFAAGTPLSFIADVKSNGAETIDIKLAITIADSNDAVVYTDTLLYEGIATDSLAQNFVFPTTTPLPSAIGPYTGTYEVFTDRIDEDAMPSNNTQSFSFNVTEDLFSKGNTGFRTIDCCADNFEFRSSNIYYTPDLGTDDSLYIDDISFAISYENFGPGDEGSLEVKTYGFRGDLNGDGIPAYGDESDPTAELVQLSILDFIIDNSAEAIATDEFITVPPSEDGPVMVPSGYVGFAVAVDYYQTDGGTNTDNDFAIYGTSKSYAGQELAAESTGNARFNSILVVPGRSIDTYGYFGGVAPIIDATVRIATEVSSANETTLNIAQFAVRPNPATTQFAIDFDFGTTVDAQFEIINAVGQTVSAFNRNGLTAGAITIPTQGMNNGLYYVKVRTNDGQTASRKLMLAR